MAAKQFEGLNAIRAGLRALLNKADIQLDRNQSEADQLQINQFSGTADLRLRLYTERGALHFSVKPTEACCAMNFLHSFTTNIPHTDDGAALIKLVMDFMLARMQQFVGAGANHRVIINMVEDRGYSGRIADPLAVVEPVENPHITYPGIWDYFHKNCARVNTMLMPNNNTGRIIHHMECIFAPDYFNDK